jgi:hypothetical protein
MKKNHRKITKKVRRHQKKMLNFLEALRLYEGLPVVA